MGELLAGGISAFVSTLLVFPFYKVVYRQQINNLSLPCAARQVASEGLVLAYRGVLPPLTSRVISIGMMFGLYDYFLFQLGGDEDRASVRLNSAVLTSVVETSILMPFDRIQAVLSANKYNNAYKNTLDVIEKLKPFGFTEYYKGYSVTMLRSAVSTGLFFTARPLVKKHVPLADGTVLHSFVSGGLLGGAVSSCVYPITVVKHIHQSTVGKTKLVKAFKNAPLFRGIGSNFMRSLLTWGTLMSVHDLILR
jgi:hypothetical protein